MSTSRNVVLVILCIVMLALLLVACDDRGATPGQDNPTSTHKPSITDEDTTSKHPSDDTKQTAAEEDTDTSETINAECKHTFDEWMTIKQATCNEQGLQIRVCSKCSISENKIIAKNDNHTEVIDAIVSPTCTASGLSEGKHCSVCERILIKQTTVQPLGHQEVTDSAIAPTCTTTGLTVGKHCSRCNKTIVAQTIVPVSEHSIVNGICTVCGDNSLEFAGGNGTEQSPYLISTATHLNNLRNYPTAHFVLTCDISFSNSSYSSKGEFYNGGKYFLPISDFSGVLDGNNHQIENLKISNYSAGLILHNNGTIKNLSLRNVDIVSNYQLDGMAYGGGSQVTALAGGIVCYNEGVIDHCSVSGRISAKATADKYDTYAYAGGIAVINRKGGHISRCCNDALIIATAVSSLTNTKTPTAYAGGIVANNVESKITNCYNVGLIEACSKANHYANIYRATTGGIAATNASGAIIQYCYNIGQTMSYNDYGYGSGQSYCYSYGITDGKPSAYYYYGKVIDSYYFEGGAYMGTSENYGTWGNNPHLQSTYMGFDFQNIWTMGVINGKTYPVLQ